MTHNPWTRRSRRVAYENPWIVVQHDEVTRPDGEPGIYGVVHFKNRAVGVVARDGQGRVILVGQYRYALDAYSWEIPEGGGPLHEDPLAAAQRELREETGLSARRWTLLGTTYTTNSVSDEEARYYLAEELEQGTPEPEGTEQLALRWVDFDEAVRMAQTGEINDALSVIALLQVAVGERKREGEPQRREGAKREREGREG